MTSLTFCLLIMWTSFTAADPTCGNFTACDIMPWMPWSQECFPYINAGCKGYRFRTTPLCCEHYQNGTEKPFEECRDDCNITEAYFNANQYLYKDCNVCKSEPPTTEKTFTIVDSALKAITLPVSEVDCFRTNPVITMISVLSPLILILAVLDGALVYYIRHLRCRLGVVNNRKSPSVGIAPAVTGMK